MPDHGRAVVVLANSTGGVSDLGLHILVPDVVGIEQLDWASIDFDGYVGSYRSASGVRFVVENRNGELFAQFKKQSFFAYRPIGEDLFMYDNAKARLRFERDAQGRVRTLFLKQNGREAAYPRAN